MAYANQYIDESERSGREHISRDQQVPESGILHSYLNPDGALGLVVGGEEEHVALFDQVEEAAAAERREVAARLAVVDREAVELLQVDRLAAPLAVLAQRERVLRDLHEAHVPPPPPAPHVLPLNVQVAARKRTTFSSHTRARIHRDSTTIYSRTRTLS